MAQPSSHEMTQLLRAWNAGDKQALEHLMPLMYEELHQGNFHDYPILRMNEMPVVETHIVESRETMGGVGETGVPPIAPAVANAIFAVTGRRIRRCRQLEAQRRHVRAVPGLPPATHQSVRG